MKLKFNFNKETAIRTEQFKTWISNGGLKATKQREEIFHIFLDSPGHKNLAQIYALVSKAHPKIGYTTVYRTLKLLTRLGLAEERKFADGETRYEPGWERSTTTISSASNAGRSSNLRTRPWKPSRRRSPIATGLRSTITGWSSMVSVPSALPGKSPPGEKDRTCKCCGSETKQTHPGLPKVILIGNPNVGKSVIFNYLTGKYVTVSNYPGTTVEVTSGTMPAREGRLQVLDTPGVNSLIPMSEDEKVTRDILLKEPQAHLVQVMDAKNLRRGLLISLQLLEMGFSFLAILNMWDEAKSRGLEIQSQTLAKILGVPILMTVATRSKGLDKIKDHLHSRASSSVSMTYPEAIEEGLSRIIPLLPEAPISKRSLALMLLAGDESLADWLHQNLSEQGIANIEKVRHEIQARFSDPLGYLINQARLRKADEVVSQVMGQRGKVPKTLSTWLGNLAMHPLWGIPILLSVLWVTYEFVGVFGAQTCVEFLEETFFGTWLLPPLTEAVRRYVPTSLLQEFLIGPYGVFTMALTYAIAIVLPIVGCFFLIFGLMEDSGYLPRLAIMTNADLQKDGAQWQGRAAHDPGSRV